MATMITNGKARNVKNLQALFARIRKDRPGSIYWRCNPSTGERVQFHAYACATLSIPAGIGDCSLVVCGGGSSGEWRYETSYASETVFASRTQKSLERAGVTVLIFGARQYCAENEAR